MKLSRRELLLVAGAASAAQMQVRSTSGEHVRLEPQTTAPPQVTPSHSPNLPIRDYLSREARRITNDSLADLETAADFTHHIAARRARFIDMRRLSRDLSAGAR